MEWMCWPKGSHGCDKYLEKDYVEVFHNEKLNLSLPEGVEAAKGQM